MHVFGSVSLDISLKLVLFAFICAYINFDILGLGVSIILHSFSLVYFTDYLSCETLIYIAFYIFSNYMMND